MPNILEKSYKTYLSHAESQQVNLHTYEAMIDKEVFNLYEIDGADLEQILREQGTPAGYFPVIEGFELIPEDMLPEAKDYVKSLQRIKLTPEKLNEMGEKLTELYKGGKTIEEIAVQMQINPVSVAAMRIELDIINSKDLKGEVENLLTHFILEQLKNDKDGIIPLYKDATEKTMVRRLVDDMEKMFGEDKVSEILNEIKQILEKDLDGWLSSDFFKRHISQYKKRPIIWHISSPERYFEVFLYYHKFNNQTLHILKNVYLSKASDYNRRRLKELDSDLTNASDKNKGMIKEKEEREEAIEDIKSFEIALEELLKQGMDPVIDDGVLANISPFQKAGLLAMDVLDKNQLKKGEELLAEYISERRQKK
ncbi:MAG: hypothetical protein OIN86_10055 [Candidatus Methanoperedens sp.]|nr:hypothetical protein [Candidatus Methanoperedens sp.]CAG0982638.1 hypothetical protein METP1_01858 [Methanosarcinales archaeon]